MELLFLSQWFSLPLDISLLPLGAAAVTAAVCAPGVFEPGAAGAEGRPSRVGRAGAPVATVAVAGTAAVAAAVAATAAVGVVASPRHYDCDQILWVCRCGNL